MSIEDAIQNLEKGESVLFAYRDEGNINVEVYKKGIPMQSRAVARDGVGIIDGVVDNLLSIVRRAAQ